MFRLQCLLTFAALYVGFARSWDIAVTTIDKLEFYDNGTKTFSQEDARFKYLSALTYDAVHNMLLFADKNNDNASIFSFYIANKKYQALVRKSPNENIHGLAFDPVTGLLFWTDTNRTSIYCNSLSPGSRKEAYGTIMFQMKDEIPGGIAVDSCRGYIYWTNTNITKPTIERARLNGSEREVIVSRDIHMPISIAVDQQTKRIYWTDDKEGMQYTIESADLDGKHRTILFEGTDDHRSNALTVSKNSIYWLDSNTNTIWKLPKHVSRQSVPVEYAVYRNENPFAIVANYPIEEQIRDQRCEALENLSGNISAIQSLSIPSDVGLFCLHGKKVDDKPLCNCTPGYTGERCEISRCQNYCFEGNCSFTTDGQPICSCNDGYAGIRCETNICENQCLNNGTCSLNKYNEPTCLCIGDYEGARCETLKIVTMMTDKPPSTTESLSSVCNCTSTQNETKLLYHVSSETQSPSSVPPPPETTSPIMEELVASCTPDWDSVRDPAIMALGILSGLLCLLCVVLITKILQLKKRPRIKKRIIVNKNVTPLTARPDQCEITIENCCNMNICETPCFEPRSTIRPKLLDSKDGKDEKKNLIANMEYPDDPY